MRLIDADRLLSLVSDFPSWNIFDKNRAIRMIEEAPTIDKTDVISYIEGLIDGVNMRGDDNG